MHGNRARFTLLVGGLLGACNARDVHAAPFPAGDAALAGGHELAIARTLASVLADAIARSDLQTAAGVAHQLEEQVERLRMLEGA